MAFPQNVNFRSTLGFVTDAANTSMENDSNNSGAVNYPTVGSQGGNIGWETFTGGNAQIRNRNAANDARIAGCHLTQNNSTVLTYRIDLPAAGTYPISLAAGDPDYARQTNVVLKDTTTSLGTLASGATSGSQRFKDATNAEYTNLTWPGSNIAVNKVFATTIARFEVGDGVNGGSICHIGIGAAIAAGPTITGGTANPVHLSTGNTITGTGFGAAQGAGTLVIGGQAQTVTAWADTSITYTANRGVNLNDVAVNAVVTDNGGTPSANYALTGFDPPAGYLFVTLASVNGTADNRITAVGDLAIGNQLEWDDSDVSINNDGTWDAAVSVTEFYVRVGVTGDGWGSLALQTINADDGGNVVGRAMGLGLKLGRVVYA